MHKLEKVCEKNRVLFSPKTVEYKDDAFLVPKNTSVIVCRMPAVTGRATNYAPTKR